MSLLSLRHSARDAEDRADPAADSAAREGGGAARHANSQQPSLFGWGCRAVRGPFPVLVLKVFIPSFISYAFVKYFENFLQALFLAC